MGAVLVLLWVVVSEMLVGRLDDWSAVRDGGGGWCCALLKRHFVEKTHLGYVAEKHVRAVAQGTVDLVDEKAVARSGGGARDAEGWEYLHTLAYSPRNVTVWHRNLDRVQCRTKNNLQKPLQ